MARATLIFGNGLGMALNPEYFSLSAGLRTVWAGSTVFSPQHRLLIQSAVPGLSEEDYPQTEDQLDQLQVALVASDFLRRFETSNVRWLADEARVLPEAFKRFIHEVGSYFHASELVLPPKFRTCLSDYIVQTKSHIATLNYDNLLYDALTGTEVLNGYSGSLLDGFWKTEGFDNKHLDRHRTARHGWYMHLHGSPLFVGNNKVMGQDRAHFHPDEDSHIVLTHVDHKPLLIQGSKILTSYWERLHTAIAESACVVLFGYSGQDAHLNDTIVGRLEDKLLVVVEWDGVGVYGERTSFWGSLLKARNMKLIQLADILTFDGWGAY